MKPMHGEIVMVGSHKRCACCATKYGRTGSKRNKALNKALARSGKRKARAEGKRQAQDF